MVAIVSNREPRFDTRGLPEGYDPHMFYEYSYQKRVKEATGIEKFLYAYIPFSIIKSFAIAIDPLYAFKVAPHPITPENRTKVRALLSVFQERKVTNSRTYTTIQPLVNYQNVGGCRSPFLVTYVTSDPSYDQFYSRQEPLPDTLVDTTSKTRLIGSKQGTLSLFKGQLFSPGRQLKTTDRRFVTDTSAPPPPGDACIIAGGTYDNTQRLEDEHKLVLSGPAATLSAYHQSQLRISETAYNVGLCEANVIGLLKGWSPFNRDYTLFRNIVELRDIPGSILSLRDTVRDLRQLYVSLSHSPSLRRIIFDIKAVAKDVPNEYLSYHFGWKQTFNDLRDLLAAPNKITKKINFLIKRNGKPTTFRSKRSFVSGESDVSGFDYDQFGLEFQTSSLGDGIKSRIERESELRLVINAGFDFPPVDAVSFRDRSFYDRIGLYPRPTDIYNLVPWTWLVDWYTGLGNYVELIDNMNRDPSIINWGMLSCISHGKLITEFQSRSRSNSQTYHNGSLVANEDSFQVNKHTSIYEFTCETRRDVATFLSVNRTSEPTSLTGYQSSIIGALLSQRADFSRGRFHVRS